MPQLNKKRAKQVEDADSSFPLIPDGVYECRLQKVEVKPGSVADVWWWHYAIIEDGDFEGETLINFTSLSEKAAFKLKETFDAFGVSADTHTDKLVGKEVRLSVGVETAQQGSRKGQQVSTVKAVLAPDDADGDDGDDDEEVF